jgi:hypothetical protein
MRLVFPLKTFRKEYSLEILTYELFKKIGPFGPTPLQIRVKLWHFFPTACCIFVYLAIILYINTNTS